MQQNARRYCEQDSADECEDGLSRLHQAAEQTRVMAGEAAMDREHRLFINSL